MTFSQLARLIIDRARADIRADLRDARYPEAQPIPMHEHLAALPPPPAPDPIPDPERDERAADYDDFDCRR